MEARGNSHGGIRANSGSRSVLGIGNASFSQQTYNIVVFTLPVLLQRKLSLSEMKGWVQGHTTTLPWTVYFHGGRLLRRQEPANGSRLRPSKRQTSPTCNSEAELGWKQRQLSSCPHASPAPRGHVIVSAPTLSSGVLKLCSFASLASGRDPSITHYGFCPFSKQHRIMFNRKALYDSSQLKGGVCQPLQNSLPLPPP